MGYHLQYRHYSLQHCHLQFQYQHHHYSLQLHSHHEMLCVVVSVQAFVQEVWNRAKVLEHHWEEVEY